MGIKKKRTCCYCAKKHKRKDIYACYTCIPYTAVGSRGHELITLLKLRKELK